MAEAASVVVEKVAESLFTVAKKEISYMWNCSENVAKLEEEARLLEEMMLRVRQQLGPRRTAVVGVGRWIKEAESHISDARNFIKEDAGAKKTCFNLPFCVNFKTLHHYGKMAKEKTSSLEQHKKTGATFEYRASVTAPTPGLVDLYPGKNLENIDKQKTILKEIIQAIKDDNTQIVGITGVGGVGKTTLANEVAKEMKNQFVDIVKITISQRIDKERIKKEAEGAATGILKGEKILIILDDMWGALKPHEVGIPCGSEYMNCKILITSRDRDVCVAMTAQKIISVDPLPPEEAWRLFERVVGKNEWDDNLRKAALDVVAECGGLPLFLEAVGYALKDKQIGIWKATLKQLREPTDEDLPYKKEGLLQLKLSYDYLQSKLAKSCFLLCAMFPEDARISLDKLTCYVPALGIFDNPDSNSELEDAKGRVRLAIDLLKSSSLLLHVEEDDKDEHDEVFFKMHDLVRDMAILIMSEDGKFWVQSGKGLREWQQQKHRERCKMISLMYNNIRELPDHELFPHLDTFLLPDNFISFVPDEFFQGMEKLKVLDMSRNFIPTLPSSLAKLIDLHSLDLSRNESLCDISVLGKLKCLVILKLRNTGIKNIPEEIGQLNNLRLLDVYSCKFLSDITPGVISKLIRLEELYVQLKEDGDCRFLMELRELKSLKILHLLVPELHYVPKDFHFKSLIEYIIQNEQRYQYSTYHDHCKRSLRISKNRFPFETSIMKLIQASDSLQLYEVKDFDNLLPDLYSEGSEELKVVILDECENVTRLVKTKGNSFPQVEEKELRYMGSFCNLSKIIISNCDSLLELFPVSVAQGLVNLRYLDITGCSSLVVIISDEDEKIDALKGRNELVSHDTCIIFPKLIHIELYYSPQLESFYSGYSIIKYPALKSIEVNDCVSMKRWSHGENHIPNIKFDHEGTQYNNINDYIAARQHEDDWILQLSAGE